ncbi:MAG: hypothetical protein M0P71_16770, partial [Melioribacteraceae bacterium]|nr:hypothetical protein [Melioribacteraceae bacterium]
KTIIGIIAVPFLFVLVFFFVGRFLTSKFIDNNIAYIKGLSSSNLVTMDSTQFNSLPFPVQNYLKHSITDLTRTTKAVSFKENGFIRTDEKSKWQELTATHFTSTVEPVFFWDADIKMNSLFGVRALDSYQKGKGNLVVKLFSSINLSTATSNEIDEGSFLRYAIETVAYPSVYLTNKNIEWEEIDSLTAKMRIRDRFNSGEAVFHFTKEYDVEKITCKRYMTTSKGAELHDYTAKLSKHETIDGYRVPTYLEAIWNLPGKDLEVIKMKLSGFRYE